MSDIVAPARTLRIAVLGASPCDRCVAACCKQAGHDYAVRLRGDDEVRRFAAFSQDARIAAREGRIVIEKVLPYVNGRCQFLGEDDRCTIYEDRPQVCREFECAPFFNAEGLGRHGLFLRRNPHVRELLKSM